MLSSAIRQISTLSTPIATAALSPVQAQIAAALASGSSISRAAAAAGVHRSTIHNWLRDSTEFRTAVKQARDHYAACLRDELRDLSALALETLRELLAAPDTPPGIRLRAALAILERPAFSPTGWRLPEEAADPGERRVLDLAAGLDPDYQAALARARTVRDAPAPAAGAAA